MPEKTANPAIDEDGVILLELAGNQRMIEGHSPALRCVGLLTAIFSVAMLCAGL
jgi:hypothetical protein